MCRIEDVANLVSRRVIDLDEKTITTLQLVSQHFRTICRDDRFWKSRCFDESVFLLNFRYRQTLLQSQIDRAKAVAKQWSAPPEGELAPTGPPAAADAAPPGPPAHARTRALGQKLRDLRAIGDAQLRANWDPSYPGEPVSWYDEYIQRYGPVVTNWFQSPHRAGAAGGLLNEVRGLALYTPGGARESGPGPLFAVSPLEDGTVCLFDVNGTQVRRGEILGRSKPGLLYSWDPANSRRTSRINSGVTECVSVDNRANRAFFAVQSRKSRRPLSELGFNANLALGR